MGLIDAFIEWNSRRKQKRLLWHKEKGLCPDCNGQGIHVLSYEYVVPHNCTSCDGSGHFTDWARTTGY